MADIKSIIDRVQKLRQLQKSSNVNEAANAAAFAEKLIAEYRISEAELNVEHKISAPIIEGAVLYSSGRVVPWKSSLALRLAAHYGVYVFNDISFSESRYDEKAGKYIKSRQITNYRMVGRETDIGLLHYNYSFLVFEIDRLCEDNCRSVRGVSVEKLSYCQGAIVGIMDKLSSEKKVVEKAASSAAMVLLDNKGAEAKSFAMEKYKLKDCKKQSHQRFDHDAYGRGKEAGGNISVNRGLGGNEANKLMGS